MWIVYKGIEVLLLMCEDEEVDNSAEIEWQEYAHRKIKRTLQNVGRIYQLEYTGNTSEEKEAETLQHQEARDVVECSICLDSF